MYVAFVAPIFFLWAVKNGNFFDFRAEKNESELKQKGHKPSRAENTSARAMARASSARAHHYDLWLILIA